MTLILLILCFSFMMTLYGVIQVKNSQITALRVRGDYWKWTLDETVEERDWAEAEVERLLSLNKVRTPDEIIGD